MRGPGINVGEDYKCNPGERRRRKGKKSDPEKIQAKHCNMIIIISSTISHQTRVVKSYKVALEFVDKIFLQKIARRQHSSFIQPSDCHMLRQAHQGNKN